MSLIRHYEVFENQRINFGYSNLPEFIESNRRRKRSKIRREFAQVCYDEKKDNRAGFCIDQAHRRPLLMRSDALFASAFSANFSASSIRSYLLRKSPAISQLSNSCFISESLTSAPVKLARTRLVKPTLPTKGIVTCCLAGQ